MKKSLTGFRAFASKRLLVTLIAILLVVVFATATAFMKSGSGSPGAPNGNNPTRPSTEAQRQDAAPISSQAVAFAESEPLSEIAKRSAAPKRVGREEAEAGEGEGGDREAAENPAIKHPTAQALAAASVPGGLVRDTALQTLMPSLSMPNPTLTFEGLGRTENVAAGFSGNLSPPDTNGYVGPNHYVQQDNLLVRVWDKAGAPLTAPFKLSGLFAPLGGQCAVQDAGDPVVLYDQLADRWLLSQFAFASQFAPPYHQCVAVSKTGDPTGAYYLYDFITAGNEFPDYPKLGSWPDGYYMMVHQFTNGAAFNGSGVYSFDRLKMIAGNPTASYIYFNLNLASHPEGVGGLLPSDLNGITPPPAGRPNTFAYPTALDFGDPADGLRLFDFHSDFAVPANSTFTERAETTYAAPLAVAAFSAVTPFDPANGRSRGVPQPAPASGVTTSLDPIADRLLHRMQYRNQGGYETLVMNHTVGAPGSTVFGTFRAAPRYYELRSTGGGAFAVQEQATFAPGGVAPGDNISRWMGSAAEDNQGNLAVGFSVSSGVAGGSVFPGIRYAGRLATDPPGGLAQGEATLIAGTGVQTSTGYRWGDYSALTVDPTDDCTFWYTTEYYTAAGQAASPTGWQTRIGNFKFTQCTAPAKGTVHFTITNCASNALIANAIVSIDGNPYGASLTNGTYDGSLAPGSHSYSITKYGHTTATGNFNIVDAQTTNVAVCLDSGTVHFIVTDCATTNPISGAAVSIDGVAVGNTAANGTLDADATPGNHSYVITKFNYANGTGNFNITGGQNTNVPVCLNGLANVGITKTADAAYVSAGAQVGFVVTLTNSGLATATGLAVTDNLPAGTGINWTIDAGNTDAGWSVSGVPPTQSLVYTPTTLAQGTSTHVHVVSATSLVCVSTIVLNNTASFTTGNDGSGQASASESVLCPPVSVGPVTVTATAATPGPTDYPTVKAAFDAINLGTHQGAINIWMFGNTTETVAAVLNASGTGSSVYTSIIMLPSGGARTISGSISAEGMILLNGADNVTIDGLKSGGNSLTISNTNSGAVSATSTIRFIGGATNNTVTNSTILGSFSGSLATNGGNIFFSTDAVSGNGNDNNTISNCDIGPAGANLPTKLIYGNGSTTTPAIRNSGILINNNNLFDYFSATLSVSGIHVLSGNDNWTISNNRIYQTATRTFTGAAGIRYAGITLNTTTAGNQGAFTVSGNTIGFGAANGTGTTTITGTGTGLGNEIRGIDAPSVNATTPTSIQGNTISGINQTSNRASSTSSSSAFIGIVVGVTTGRVDIGTVTGNTIGSLDGSSTIVVSQASITANNASIIGIYDNSFVSGNSISNNKVGAITISNGGTGTTTGFRGILLGQTAGVAETVANNTIGGPVPAGAITDNIVGANSLYAIQIGNANVTATGNLIRNITGNSTTANGVVVSGLLSTGSTGANTFSRNTIHSLSNNSGAASNSIYALYCSFAAVSGNLVERNFVHSLTMTSSVTTGQLVGILPIAGNGTYQNNMVRLGVDAAGASVTSGLAVYGMFEVAGTNNLYYNSVYVGGSGVTSSSNTFAFVSNVVTNTRNYKDNIFWNARSNASGAGKNYAIVVGGTTPNPAGLTSNYNDLYATGTGGFVGLFNAVDQPALSDWQTATGQDANSISVDPQFISPGGPALPSIAKPSVSVTVATVNLHIQGTSPCVNAGTSVAGVTNDFDGDMRDLTPDIGADQLPGPTAADANIGGSITDSDGAVISGVTISLSGTQAREAITDSSGRYSFDSVETNGFYTVTPASANYTFSPANRSFSLLGVHTEASFTATANNKHVNLLDSTEFFVRQHYLDFLGREPDAPGFAGWVSSLNNCAPGDASCDRVHVSEMFYRSQEFQERGYFAYRFYSTALGRKPDYAEFGPDLARVSGFLTNDQLEAAKTAFVDEFMARPAFAGAYDHLSDTAFVDTLMGTAGVNLSNRQALIDSLNNKTASRADVLRQIAESSAVYAKYYNQAFVVMEYFGYLHRDPDALYTDWIRVLDANPADARRMVDGFVNSAEYRNRFVQ